MFDAETWPERVPSTKLPATRRAFEGGLTTNEHGFVDNFVDDTNGSALLDKRNQIHMLWKSVCLQTTDCQLSKLLLTGVPAKRREEVWCILANIHKWVQGELYNQFEAGVYMKYYEEAKSLNSPELNCIAKSLSCYKFHPVISETAPQIFRVCAAFSKFKQFVYTESVFHIASSLLAVVTEEKAFWLLIHIHEVILENSDCRAFIGAQRDSLIVQELLARAKDHQIVKKINELEISVPVLVAPWLLRCFAGLLPTETVFRIWDLMFFNGSDVLIKVAAGIFFFLDANIPAGEWDKINDIPKFIALLSLRMQKITDADALLSFGDAEGTRVHRRTIDSYSTETAYFLQNEVLDGSTLKFFVDNRPEMSTTQLIEAFPSPPSTLYPFLFACTLDTSNRKQLFASLSFLVLLSKCTLEEKISGLLGLLRKYAPEGFRADFVDLCGKLVQFVFAADVESYGTGCALCEDLLSRQMTHEVPARAGVCRADEQFIAMDQMVFVLHNLSLVSWFATYETFARADTPIQAPPPMSPALMRLHSVKMTTLELRRARGISTTSRCVATGYFFKAGGQNCDKPMRKRYFVLTTTELTYQQNEKENPRGTIAVSDMVFVHDLGKTNSKKWQIKLETNGRDYLFAFEDEREKRKWFDALLDVSQSQACLSKSRMKIAIV